MGKNNPGIFPEKEDSGIFCDRRSNMYRWEATKFGQMTEFTKNRTNSIEKASKTEYNFISIVCL